MYTVQGLNMSYSNKKETYGNNSEKLPIKYYLFVFLLALIPRIFCAVQALPLRTLSDETATLSVAAFLSGKDWSAVVSKAGYYGYGYYWIFYPLFKYLSDSILIYKIIMIIGACVQALSAPIALGMLHHYFNIKEISVKILISTVCSYFVVTRAVIAYNEHILILLTWLLALLFCRLWSKMQSGDVKGKRIDTGLLALLLIYSLTIHVRALTFFLACGLMVVICRMIYKKWIVSRSLFIIFGLGYILSSFLTKIIQNQIWLANEKGGELVNSSINISKSISFLNVNTWKTFLLILLGQVTTVSVFSCGFFLLTIFLWIMMISYICKSKKRISISTQLSMVIITLFGIAIGMTIGAQMLSWGPGAIKGIEQNIYDGDYYSYKVFTYVRYFGPYIGPFLMGGMVLLYHHTDKFLKLKYLWFLSAYTVISCFSKILLPYIQNNKNTVEVFIPFGLWWFKDDVKASVYLAGIFFMFLFSFFIMVSKKKTHFLIILFLMSGIMVYGYCYSAFAYDIAGQKDQYSRVNDIYEFVQRNSDMLKSENINEVYVLDKTSATNHQSYYIIQYYLKDYKIIPDMPPESVENAVVLSNKECSSDFEGRNFKVLKLDKYEFVYILGNLVDKVTGV